MKPHFFSYLQGNCLIINALLKEKCTIQNGPVSAVLRLHRRLISSLVTPFQRVLRG